MPVSGLTPTLHHVGVRGHNADAEDHLHHGVVAVRVDAAGEVMVNETVRVRALSAAAT